MKVVILIIKFVLNYPVSPVDLKSILSLKLLKMEKLYLLLSRKPRKLLSLKKLKFLVVGFKGRIIVVSKLKFLMLLSKRK